MLLRLRFTEAAASDIERAERWMRSNRTLAPDAFRQDLSGAWSLLSREPGIGVPVVNTRLPQVRRLHLGRIRYFVDYRLRADELIVLSVWHSSRGAGPRL